MKLKISRIQLVGGTEITVELERTSGTERARWAAEDAATYHTALSAIAAAPDSAQEIVEGVLESE